MKRSLHSERRFMTFLRFYDAGRQEVLAVHTYQIQTLSLCHLKPDGRQSQERKLSPITHALMDVNQVSGGQVHTIKKYSPQRGACDSGSPFIRSGDNPYKLSGNHFTVDPSCPLFVILLPLQWRSGTRSDRTRAVRTNLLVRQTPANEN